LPKATKNGWKIPLVFVTNFNQYHEMVEYTPLNWRDGALRGYDLNQMYSQLLADFFNFVNRFLKIFISQI